MHFPQVHGPEEGGEEKEEEEEEVVKSTNETTSSSAESSSTSEITAGIILFTVTRTCLIIYTVCVTSLRTETISTPYNPTS